MPVVAAPAAVVGGVALAWFLFSLVSPFDSARAGQVTAGFLFGLGVCLVLMASHRQPIAAVIPPRWRRSMLNGAICGAAVLLLGLAVFGPAGVLTGVAAGLTATLAGRRTVVHLAPGNWYRLMIGVTVVTVLSVAVLRWLTADRAITGAGVLLAGLAALIMPMPVMLSWLARVTAPLPVLALRPAQTQNLHSLAGYQEEALALGIFLAPDDIPRSLVIKIALETKPGRASSLNTLAPSAFQESGPDALSIDPLTQRLAFHRLSQPQRREWTAKAVRELAAFFPDDYAENPAWCERLAPHALAAASHAYKLDAERGAAALLLNQVAGYLLLSERSAEASEVLHLALVCATAAFGPSAEQTTAIRSNLAVSPAAMESFQRLTTPAPRTARRAREPMPEHRILAFGLSIVVLIAAVLVGGLLWREGYMSRPQPAGHPLRTVADLQELCADRQRFYPEAAPYEPPSPHRIQLFFRESISDSYASERLTGVVPDHWRTTVATLAQVQLVGCVTRTRTGPKTATCQQAFGADVLMHQATYEINVYAAKTAEPAGSAEVTITATTCPPAAQGGRIYARPAYPDYERAIGDYVG